MKAEDKVICIRSNSVLGRVFNPDDSNDCTLFRHPGAQKGKVYTVRATYRCRCGMIAIDVGIDNPRSDKLQTCKCGASVHAPCWWHNANRFRPIDWDDCCEELINEVLEKKTETETIK